MKRDDRTGISNRLLLLLSEQLYITMAITKSKHSQPYLLARQLADKSFVILKSTLFLTKIARPRPPVLSHS
jgi:hypothetical protein